MICCFCSCHLILLVFFLQIREKMSSGHRHQLVSNYMMRAIVIICTICEWGREGDDDDAGRLSQELTLCMGSSNNYALNVKKTLKYELDTFTNLKMLKGCKNFFL